MTSEEEPLSAAAQAICDVLAPWFAEWADGHNGRDPWDRGEIYISPAGLAEELAKLGLRAVEPSSFDPTERPRW